MIFEDLNDRGELSESTVQAEYLSRKPVRDFVRHPRITSLTLVPFGDRSEREKRGFWSRTRKRTVVR